MNCSRAIADPGINLQPSGDNETVIANATIPETLPETPEYNDELPLAPGSSIERSVTPTSVSNNPKPSHLQKIAKKKQLNQSQQ